MNELFTLQMDLTQVVALISLWIPPICCQKYLFQKIFKKKENGMTKIKKIH